MFLADGPMSAVKTAILHSLFLAVILEADEQERVGSFTDAYKRQHRLCATPRPPGLLHASLWSFAKNMEQPPPDELIDRAQGIGDRVTLSPFKVMFNRVESWTRASANGPIVLVGDEGVIGLERLHAAVAQAQSAKPDPGFVPHVTLMWGRDVVAPDYIRPLSWTVREFALVHSHVGESRYDIKARFPLVYG